jgi:adenine-specific DNA-methyltransferase
MVLRKPDLSLQTTTLWEYPSQHYGHGARMQGDARYVGATPSYVVWNLLSRYTRPHDCVVDPFCGSGTTLDVAADLQRQAHGFDIQPYRPDIVQADARSLPLPNNSCDFWFADPPYGDHITYSGQKACIGTLSATSDAYFQAMDQVFKEAFRVLKDRRFLAVYVCDYYSKKEGFVPTGAKLSALMAQYFVMMDHVAVVRHNKSLKKGQYHKAAEEGNFFLRGFNHLLIAKKHC